MKTKPDRNSSRMGNPDRPSFDLLCGLDDMCVKHLETKNNPIVLEIGSYNGVSTSLFAFYAKRVVAIDPQCLDTLKQVVDNHDNIEYYMDYSMNVVPKFENEAFDLVYVDGFHDYENCMRDIMLTIPKLKKTGNMCGHDYHRDHPGVVAAVNNLLQVGILNSFEVFEDSSWSANVNYGSDRL
jgi:SAM-dependent methyltransferase